MAKTREEYNAYMRVYNKRRYHRLRGELIEQLGGRCVKCGAIDKLELDHINASEKNIDIGKCMLHGSLIIAGEIDKIQLLCATCHDKKSLVDLGYRATKNTKIHGTMSSIRYCKCSICKLTVAIYNKYRRVVPYSIIKDFFPTA